jgi:YD repeat-containing protein
MRSPKAPLAVLLTTISQMAYAQSASDFAPPPNPYSVNTSGGVDVTTRQFSLTSEELSVGTSGAELPFVRYYRLVPPPQGFVPSGPFGSNATHNQDIHLTVNNGIFKTVDIQDGPNLYSFRPSSGTFPDPSTTYTQMNGAGDSIEFQWNGSVIQRVILTKSDGERIFFEGPQWYLAAYRELPNGSFVTYKYEQQNGPLYGYRVKSVVNSHGYGLQFTYPSLSSDARLTQVSAFRASCVNNVVVCSSGVLPSVNYSYEPDGNGKQRVKTVTDPRGKTASYYYDSSNRMTHAYYPASPTTKMFQNVFPTGNGMGAYVYVLSQSDALGKTTIYNITTDASYNKIVTLIDPDQKQTIFKSTAASRLIGITDQLGNVTSLRYALNGPYYNGKVDKVTFPESNAIESIFDSGGNVIQKWSRAKPG